LNRKALRTGSEDQNLMYFEELIAEEMMDKRQNYLERVKAYKEQVEKYKLLIKSSKNNEGVVELINQKKKDIVKDDPSFW
jgi:hypothetical protein